MTTVCGVLDVMYREKTPLPFIAPIEVGKLPFSMITQNRAPGESFELDKMIVRETLLDPAIATMLTTFVTEDKALTVGLTVGSEEEGPVVGTSDGGESW